MSVYVIDASVGFKWLFPEEFEAQADELISKAHTLWVPDLFFSEITNILWKRVRAGLIDQKVAKNSIKALEDFNLKVARTLDLQIPALEIACLAGQSTYDCLYVALAVEQNTQMITADKRLYNALQSTQFATFVEWIGNL